MNPKGKEKRDDSLNVIADDIGASRGKQDNGGIERAIEINSLNRGLDWDQAENRQEAALNGRPVWTDLLA